MALTLASNAITFTDNTSLSSGIIGTAQLSAGAIQQSFGNTSGAFNFRNKIINGNFDIWQRGTSFDVSSSTYTADRWSITFDETGGTRTISRQAFSLGQTDVPNEPTYYLRFQQTAAGSNGTYNALRQKIESVKTTAGKTVTISFYAKADSARTINIGSAQSFGTGGSPSAPAFSPTRSVNLTTSWQKYTVTTTVPSIAGKELGTDNNDWSSVTFNVPLNTTFTIDIAQVQLEEGPVATPFEQRPIGLELSLCQRYYNTFTIYGVSQYAYTNATYNIHISFPTAMRIPPAITLGPLANTYNTNTDTTRVLSATHIVHQIGPSVSNGGFGRVRYNNIAEAEL